MEYKKLHSGNEIPVVGLGTWQSTGDDCKNAVKVALDSGYRHIDTALMYGNHKQIAEALKESGTHKNEVFITSKIWRDDLSKEGVKKQVDRILDELEIDYIDLVLIHWPNKEFDMKETFKGLKDVVDEGKVTDIGVSNFTISHIEKAIEASPVKITMNQVEYHPYLNQEELLKFCLENDIHVTAYSPLARGEVFQDSTLNEIAKTHNKTVAQIVVRWQLQKGMITIPKSSSKERIDKNIEVFNFELSEEEMDRINSLNENRRLINPSFAEFE